jgi:hypothetical protein
MCFNFLLQFKKHISSVTNIYLKMSLLFVKICFVVLPALLLEIGEITLIATGGLGLIDTSEGRVTFSRSVVDHEILQ